MLVSSAPLPTRRADLVIRPLGDQGQYVVKDPRTADYFHLGPHEHYLLIQLDGVRDTPAVCAAFEKQFGEPLTEEDLHEFIETVEAQGLLEASGEREPPETEPTPASRPRVAPSSRPRQSILHWRKSLFDPDRLMTWLAPRIRFFWTHGFLLFSAGCILLAVALVWFERNQIARSVFHALRWETAVLVWLTLFVVTMLHEFAHGLTCKHHGGEVHEIGFLLIFFMPCFYCDVSDAWLFREKSKRLWVTFAGSYFQLVVWALAVFVWRLTVPDSLLHSLSFIVLALCGMQALFNFNPLIKLDGYYLLSDWVEEPNLQQRAQDHFKAHLRRLLWGAPRPAGESRGRLLFRFGLVSWLYSLVLLALVLWGLLRWVGGWWGAGGVALLAFLAAPGLFKGFTAGEVGNMIARRWKRTFVWLLILGGLAAGLCLVEMEDRSSGPVRLRPAIRAELRAPVAGFVREVYSDEGTRVAPGALVARLEVPELESRLARKQAEVDEGRARLRLLEIGPRPEEVAEQRRRVERARVWRDLAQHDLTRTRQVLEAELVRLDKDIAARGAELEVAQDGCQRTRSLVSRRALADEQQAEAEGKFRVCQARLAEAQAARRAVETKGTLEAEAELARREKELAEAGAVLRLLEAGTRLEEVQAEKARLVRLQEEMKHLEELQQKQSVTAPVAGLITTARLKEKVGQYLREGDVICLVEEPDELEVEISLAEQDVARVRAGQEVKVKARALPFDDFPTRVARLAPAAGRGEVQSSVLVHCRLEQTPADLRPDMTGFARVYVGRRPIGGILLDRALRWLRTEFWW
jgi:multidrug resistance efflux pump